MVDGTDAEDRAARCSVIERLCAAVNAHDIEALVACFAESYVNETPAHPSRGFTGRDQVRANWSQIFALVSDIEARVVRVAVAGTAVWSEWEHSGHRSDGSMHIMRGVVIFGVDGDVITWGRFYMEPVEHDAATVDDFLRRQLRADTGS